MMMINATSTIIAGKIQAGRWETGSAGFTLVSGTTTVTPSFWVISPLLVEIWRVSVVIIWVSLITAKFPASLELSVVSVSAEKPI